MDQKDTYVVGFWCSSSWLFPSSTLCLVRHWTLAVWTLHSVSSGKHSGTFVSTAPVAEPTVILFTVPLDVCTIVVTVVTSYSSSGDCCGPFVLRECLRRDVGGGCFSWWCLRFCMGQCEVDFWKLRAQLFPVPRGRGCVCMLNFWFSRYDTICADNYIYFRFKLQACVAVRSGSCICMAVCSSRWTVIAWIVAQGCAFVSALTQLGNESHTIYVLCLPLSVAWE